MVDIRPELSPWVEYYIKFKHLLKSSWDAKLIVPESVKTMVRLYRAAWTLWWPETLT
jgi:hypothetical protein